MKAHTEMTNREVGEYFEGLSYSAVAKIRERFSGKLAKDRALKRRVEKIERYISNVNC